MVVPSAGFLALQPMTRGSMSPSSPFPCLQGLGLRRSAESLAVRSLVTLRAGDGRCSHLRFSLRPLPFNPPRVWVRVPVRCYGVLWVSIVAANSVDGYICNMGCGSGRMRVLAAQAVSWVAERDRRQHRTADRYLSRDSIICSCSRHQYSDQSSRRMLCR